MPVGVRKVSIMHELAFSLTTLKTAVELKLAIITIIITKRKRKDAVVKWSSNCLKVNI